MNHYGNLIVDGVVAVGQRNQQGYVLPEAIGASGEALIVVQDNLGNKSLQFSPAAAPIDTGDFVHITGDTMTGELILTAGITSSTSGSNSEAFGKDALKNTVGNNNTAVGYQTLYLNDGSNNVALGHKAGYSSYGDNKLYISNVDDGYDTSLNLIYGEFDSKRLFINAHISTSQLLGYDNEAFGADAGTNFSFGIYANTAIGSQSQAYNYNSNENTSVGAYSLYTNTSSGQNVAIGVGAAYFKKSGGGAVAIGWSSQYYSGNSNLPGPNGVGIFSTDSANTSVAVGYNSLLWNADQNNTAVGHGAGKFVLSRNNTAIGRASLYGAADNDSFYGLFPKCTGGNNTALGGYTLRYNSTGYSNTAIGWMSSLQNTEGFKNTSLGEYALANNVSGSYNVAIGVLAGYNESGSNKLYIDSTSGTGGTSASALIYGEFDSGYLYNKGALIINSSNYVNFMGNYYVAKSGDVMSGSLTITPLAGNANTVVAVDGTGKLEIPTATLIVPKGITSPKVSASLFNESYGISGLYNLTTGTYNVAVGALAGSKISSGTQNTCVGYNAAGNSNGNTGLAVAVGYNAMGLGAAFSTPTNGNVAVGAQAQMYSGSLYNVQDPNGTPITIDTRASRFSVAVGFNAGLWNSERDSTAIGQAALKNVIGARNTAVGRNSIQGVLYSDSFSGLSIPLTYCNFNTSLGAYALANIIAGDGNVAVGDFTMGLSAYTPTNGMINNISNNTAVGKQALVSLNSATGNTALGVSAGATITGGNYNVFLGFQAGYNEKGSNKLYIDSTTLTNGTSATALIYGEFDNKHVYINDNLTIRGKLTVDGLIDPTGLQLTPVAANPGDTHTIWVNSGDNNLYLGSSVVNGGGGFIPLTNGTISITSSGSNYVFDVNDYISKSEVGSISGDIVTGTGFVQKIGDTMSGDLNINGASLNFDYNEYFQVGNINLYNGSGCYINGGTLTANGGSIIADGGCMIDARSGISSGNDSGGHNSGTERFGYNCLPYNYTNFNTGVGFEVLYDNTSGDYNTAVGSRAGYANTGFNNVFIGSGAGQYNAMGSNNIFIGHQAGQNETGADKLIIDYDFYGAHDSTTAFIYGDMSSLTLNINAELYVQGVQVTSDRKFKTDIEPILDGVDVVNALKPVSYTFIPTSGSCHGFIAQDVEEILPEAVHTNNGVKSLNYNAIIAHLVSALQDTMKEVNTLKAQVQQLMNNN